MTKRNIAGMILAGKTVVLPQCYLIYQELNRPLRCDKPTTNRPNRKTGPYFIFVHPANELQYDVHLSVRKSHLQIAATDFREMRLM